MTSVRLMISSRSPGDRATARLVSVVALVGPDKLQPGKSVGGSWRGRGSRHRDPGCPPNGRSRAAAGLRHRRGHAACGPSPSCRRHPLRPFRPGSRLPFFRRFQRLTVDDRGARAGLAVERVSSSQRSQTPSRWNCRKMCKPSSTEGTGRLGRYRHGQPVRRRWKIAFIAAHVGLARPPAGFRRRNQRLQTLPLRITQIAGKGRSRLLVGRPMRLRPHPKSKPPSHLAGGKSRAANPRYKLSGPALMQASPETGRAVTPCAASPRRPRPRSTSRRTG